MPDVDLEEIFLHIEQLKSEKESIHGIHKKRKLKEKRKVDKSDSVNPDRSSKMDISKADDLDNKIIKKLNGLSSENSSKLFEKESESNVKSNVLSSGLNDNIELDDVSKKSDEHLFENNKNDSDFSQISYFNLKDDSYVTCDICKNEIILGKNLSGLVVEEEFFACENCCKSSTKDELTEWTKNRMVSPYNVRPIGIWLIQKRSENKSTLFKK